ncbi:pantetheinase-like [Diadema setosum]|uniref:pantetheinase-like n=1 Tax=Diadema setosum TaxID=31175 RepID=UPI003B3A6F08
MAPRKAMRIILLAAAVFLLMLMRQTSADYTAAVVEHKAISWLLPFVNRDQATAIINLNLDIYDYYALTAASKGTDIIVFPEYGITGFVNEERDHVIPYLEEVPTPSKSRAYIPCHEKSIVNITIQHRLSCLALKHNITIVANLMTIQPCEPKTDPDCPPDGRYQYNTDVAFAENGRLVARYHKENLYTGEAKVFNPGHGQGEVAAFQTSFGYFGLFTCFDILFAQPVETLVNKLGVDTMVFPTAWMNELPLLSAAEYQQAWSLSYGVNLLAANQHYPIAQMTGSGIFSPHDGAVTYTYDMESILGKMLMGEVKTGASSKTLNEMKYSSGIHLTYDKDLSGITSGIKSSLLEGINGGLGNSGKTNIFDRSEPAQGIPKYFIAKLNDDPYNVTLLTGKQGRVSISNNNVSCTLNFSRQSESELYALGVFDGLHTMNGDYYIQCCSLVRCGSDNDPYRCGAEVSDAATVFSNFDLRIEGQSAKTRLFPEVVATKVQLPPVREEWTFSEERDQVWSIGEGVKDPIIAVNIFGRWYERD